MSWLTEHAQRISDWQKGIAERNQNWIPKGWRGGMAPGSPMSLADAIAADRWSNPYGGEPNSMDIYFGGGSAVNPGSEGRWARGVGRGVGTVAGLWAGGSALGLGGGTGAGPTEVGAGLPLAEEAGAGMGAGSSGLLETPWGVNSLEPAGEWAGTYSNTPTYGSESWWPEPGSSGGGGNWWQQGTAPSTSGGFNWNQFFGRGGAGQMGIGGLAMLLNAMQQRKDAKKGEEDEQAAVQQGTNAMARSLSTEGNPAGSGRAQQELQNYATIALARFRAARRARMSEANQNMYGAGGVSLAALLQALAQSGAFSGGGSTETA